MQLYIYIGIIASDINASVHFNYVLMGNAEILSFFKF